MAAYCIRFEPGFRAGRAILGRVLRSLLYKLDTGGDVELCVDVGEVFARYGETKAPRRMVRKFIFLHLSWLILSSAGS